MLTNVCYSTDLQCESLCIHGRSRTPVPTIKIQFTLVNPNLSYKLTKKVNAVALKIFGGFPLIKKGTEKLFLLTKDLFGNVVKNIVAVGIRSFEEQNAEISAPHFANAGVWRREELFAVSIEISECEIEAMLRSLNDVVML